MEYRRRSGLAEGDSGVAVLDGAAVSVGANRADILATATRIVMRDRNALHGDPEENHANIAEVWNVYLRQRFDAGVVLTPRDAAMLMALMKIVRATHNPRHMDSIVDAVGYLAIVGELTEEAD